MQDVQFLDTSHGRSAYRASKGEGLPVLMLHGNSSYREVFHNQLDGEVGQRFQCIALDLMGHGDSDDAENPEQSYTIPGYANAAVEVMQKLGISRYAVVGWSLGGHIALEMTAQTDCLAGIAISGAPPVDLDPAGIAAGFNGNLEGSLATKPTFTEEEAAAFAEFACGADFGGQERVLAMVLRCDGRAREIMARNFVTGNGTSQKELATRCSVPLAIINGAHDGNLNHGYIESLPYQNLWKNTVFRMQRADHAPCVQNPAEFDQLLIEFLSDCET